MRSRALIWLVCAAKAGRLSSRMLTSAPSLISRPNRSRNRTTAGQGYALDRAQIDDEGAQIVAEQRSRPEVRRRFCLEPLAAARHTPPNNVTRVTSGSIGRSRPGRNSRKRTEPSAKRQRHSPGSARRATRAATSDGDAAADSNPRAAWLSASARRTRWLLSLRRRNARIVRVFGGSPSLASNSATRAVSASICFVRPATTRSCASACANTSRITLSLPSLQGLRDSSQSSNKARSPLSNPKESLRRELAHPTS